MSLANTPSRNNLGLPQLLAIVLFSALAPAVLMTAPAIAAQLATQWALGPSQIGNLFSAELAAMSLATLPAYLWQSRADWRKVAAAAALVFVGANLASAWAGGYGVLLALRVLSALAGGTLMVLCIASAAASDKRDRVYGLWVSGQLVFGAIGLWVLPDLFARFGLRALYLGLALLMLLCLPLAWAFPRQLQAAPQGVGARRAPAPVLRRAVFGIAAILAFYVGLSGVWTFIGSVASAAGIAAQTSSKVLAIASLMGILGAGTATWIGSRGSRRGLLLLGYGAMAAAVLLLLGSPGEPRFAVAALLFKYTWTFALPFILATVAELDRGGRLMNTVNLVIGGGLALGPAIAGPLIESRAGMPALLLVSAGLIGVSLALILCSGQKARAAEPAGDTPDGYPAA